MDTHSFRIAGPLAVFVLLLTLLMGGGGNDMRAQVTGSGSAASGIQYFHTSSAQCGNGVVQPGEQCDDGWRNGQTSCNTNCKFFTCGDGVLSPQIGEECEPPAGTGAQLCGRYCSPKCKWAFGPACASSGSLVSSSASSPLPPAKPASVVSASSSLAASASSAAQSSSPVPARAPAVASSKSSSSPAKASRSSARASSRAPVAAPVPPPSPASSAAIPPPAQPGPVAAPSIAPFCGDGVVQEGEQCDNGPLNSDAIPNSCRTDCQLSSCGDGVVDNGEECDNGDANSDTAPNSCRTTCKLPACGDGVVDGGEQCDDGAANGTPGDLCTAECLSVPPPKHLSSSSSSSGSGALTGSGSHVASGSGVVKKTHSGAARPVPSASKSTYNPDAQPTGGSPLFTIVIVGAGLGVPLLVGFLFRKKFLALLGRNKEKSIEDIPLNEIEMPWHKW